MSNQRLDLINKKIRAEAKLKKGLYYRNVITDDIVRVLKVNYTKETLVFQYVSFLRYDDNTIARHNSDFQFFLSYFKPFPLLQGILLDVTKGVNE